MRGVVGDEDRAQAAGAQNPQGLARGGQQGFPQVDRPVQVKDVAGKEAVWGGQADQRISCPPGTVSACLVMVPAWSEAGKAAPRRMRSTSADCCADNLVAFLFKSRCDRILKLSSGGQ